jgi:1-acyl-sn-glycerol-3-phosphate acyltransferase
MTPGPAMAAPPDRPGDDAPAAPSGAAPPAPDPDPPGTDPPGPVRDPAADLPDDWEATLTEALAFVRRRLSGDYAVDEFGFDADLTDNLILPLLRPLYRSWFRVETSGLHHVPDVGGALVVANHSGTVPLDALMTSVALHDDHPAQRHLRMLGADLLFRLPVVGQLSRKHGSTLACTPDAERLLADGELVGVWPEGFKGIGKPFADRYKLQRFGRGGFVTAALRTGTPIVPCSIVGAEEAYPKIGDIAPLARLLNLPYFPVTPTFPLLGPLGAVPLPSKWLIEFGEPIPTAELGPDAADDPMLVFNLADQVRETIQHTLYRLLARRRNAFRG